MLRIGFTAIRPTGSPHLGNFLGVLKWVGRWHKNGVVRCCIADLHAMDVRYGSRIDLRERVYIAAAVFLAVGVPKEEIFLQSAVPAHAELAWILNYFTPLGRLKLMTQFKDKCSSGADVTAGLLTYPVLMAADILLHNTDFVPVGDDQEQHLEFVRDLAERFNKAVGESVFKLPTTSLQVHEASRVMNLQDATTKMSKSNTSSAGYISLMDSEEEIRKKIGSAKTDSDLIPFYSDELEKRPEAENLLSIYAALELITIMDALKIWHGSTWGEFKSQLADTVVRALIPVGNKIACQLEDINHIEDVLLYGAVRANRRAEDVMRNVRSSLRMGL